MAQRTLIFLAGLLWAAGASAQTTRVRGQVTDAADGKPLQFVSVVFPGTTTGITTDEQGIYALETRDTVSRVQASMVGYATRTLPLTPGTFNHVDFALEAVEFGIGQVVITPGENPAYPILDGVIRNKPLNDPERYDTYSCRTYTKMELDLTNIRPQFRSRRLQRNFGFVFDYVDTSALTGQAYLPAMISESTADLYRSSHPAFKREVIRASRISGVEDNFAAAQFTGGMHGDVNFYDNFIDIFNVRFASPLSDGGRAFYNYFLVDSMVTEGRKIYKIRFHPKRLTTPVLDGEVNIDSASYALQSASARMPKGVNVNWIRHLMLDNENRPADKGRWFRVRDRVSAEFSVSTADSSKLTSFIGTREVAYSDVRIGEPIPDEVLRMDNNVVVRDEEPGHRREEFWEQVRPYSLSEKEKGIYAMVDSVQHVPLYRNIYTLINTVIVGYWNTKYIGIGPYYKLASFNKLEGFRMQLGGRTTTEVSRTVRVGGLRGLRHARRGREGRRQRRGGLQPPPHAQTDPHGTARRDAARRRAERADREQHPLVDTLARRPAALDGQPRRGGLRTRVVSRREHLRRRAHAAHLRQPLRADAAARRCARQLGFRRRGARRPAALEKRNGLPHALRQAVDGFGLPHPDARILGGDSRRAARQLRILPPRRRHPLPSGTAARGVFGHHGAGRAHLRQGPLPTAQTPRGQRHLFLRSLRLLVHEFLRVRLRRMGVVVLGAPLQRRAAGPPAADQKS